ncbi:MAG: helix-turn-helix transcriptional regulator [Oscillospiraceae bacterium]|nr:helix-turn-helix transcriptional regulator [Oscillospiraceae bacterium]
MFSERLNKILTLLGVTSGDFANFAGCDKSYISRLASGARVPKNGGAGAWRLVNGIYLFADEKGKTDELCELISCRDKSSANGIKAQIMVWLYDGEKAVGKRAEQPKEKVSYRAFGEKLNAVMELAEISNIRLGKLVNIDTSYISRFRNGLRSPKSNPRMMDALCNVLLHRLGEQNKIKQLAVLMKVDPDAMTDKEEAFALFHDWLYHAEKADSSSVIEKLLENIDTFSIDAKTPLPSFEEVAVERTVKCEDTVYFGSTGLQNAVIRFLGSVISDGGKELYLYSDQNVSWLTDPVFRLKWAALMLGCVQKGIRIHIIHYVDRDVSEMIEAIISWLPLYMSGMIRSYYCKKQKNSRFSNTFFLCPGVACIKGSNVIGTEDQSGEYRYDTDPKILEIHQAAFNGLLADAKQLVRIYGNLESEGLIHTGNSGMTVLGTTLPLATMPKETLVSILVRCGADETVKNRALSVWESRKKLLSDTLHNSFVHECIPLADEESLFGNRVFADIPGLTVTYTPNEYAEHIRNIMVLSDENPQYRFYALPDAPFANTQIVISNDLVTVSRLNAPQVTFLISHPAMYEAFVAYADRITVRHKLDKLSTKRLLERYL